MVVGGFLLAGLVLALWGEPAVETRAAPVTPAECAAATAASNLQSGSLDPELERYRMTWNALAFRQTDGPLRTLFEIARLSNDVAATRGVVAACRRLDPGKIMPTLPAAPAGRAETCEQAAAALEVKDPRDPASRADVCKSLDRKVAGFKAIMDGLEAGELSCKTPDPSWITAGAMALTVETIALGSGCRAGTVKPTMATMSPAPRA